MPANPKNPNPKNPRRSRNQERETSDECECNARCLWHADRTDDAENPAAAAGADRAYLTESDQRRKWLAAGKMEMKVGTPFEFVWRNNELTDPPGERPAGFGEEHRMQGRITELDPPHKISFTWDNTGDVSFELEARGEKVLLTVTHR